MKDFKTFKKFLNESLEIIDYSKSNDTIIVGKNDGPLLDKLYDYVHVVDGFETRFYLKGKHFATLYDNPKSNEIIKHNGLLNNDGTLNKK